MNELFFNNLNKFFPGFGLFRDPIGELKRIVEQKIIMNSNQLGNSRKLEILWEIHYRLMEIQYET